ncbi:3-hydroxybutyrate dehydrogenase [Mangrovitalea sediminis]|uniref:3-hydroxybutyrate dehydrogenase n=1 Tax=Mangrovitalea sediminis TaxID=1982043 RepID=UPI000BE4DA10|nr:3-hydroxybutyrate dehydrogenase [Mangrovitalea sediminis]
MNSDNVLITGSTSGIGLATARVLAGRGFNLMLNGLESGSEGDSLAQGLQREFGVKAAYCQADLSNVDQLNKLIDAAETSLGPIGILVNNAGIQFTSSLAEFPVEKWNAIIAINLSAAFHTMKRLMPAMKDAGWGRVINIASVHGLVASPQKAAYCAAKHGLVGLSKVAALEYAEYGVTVNCICPGWTETPILNHQFNEFAKANGVSFEEAKRGLIKTKTPYPELIKPEAIGRMIQFLISDSADAITGASLPIDGGWTAL